MKKDLVIEFILKGEFPNIPFGTRTTRMSLINMLGMMEGVNKKNGVYEILKKENIVFYFGMGARGHLQGIKINNLLSLKIERNSIQELLQSNNILYKLDEDVLVLDNGIIISFDENQKNIIEVLKADTQMIESKMLATNKQE